MSKAKTIKRIKTTIQHISDPLPNEFGWPPSCMGVFYQPDRPVRTARNNESDNMENDHTLRSELHR